MVLPSVRDFPLPCLMTPEGNKNGTCAVTFKADGTPNAAETIYSNYGVSRIHQPSTPTKYYKIKSIVSVYPLLNSKT